MHELPHDEQYWTKQQEFLDAQASVAAYVNSDETDAAYLMRYMNIQHAPVTAQQVEFVLGYDEIKGKRAIEAVVLYGDPDTGAACPGIGLEHDAFEGLPEAHKLGAINAVFAKIHDRLQAAVERAHAADNGAREYRMHKKIEKLERLYHRFIEGLVAEDAE